PSPPAPVVTGPGDQQAPHLDGDMLVYEDDSAGTWDIRAKNLATAATPFPVYVGPGDQRAPAISGDLVVWQDNRNGDWDIYGAYLSTGQVFPIFVGPGDQTNPVVSGSRVAWQSAAPGSGRWDIVAEDLATGQPLTLSDPTLTNTSPALDQTLVVWQSTVPTSTRALPAAAGWQIHGYDLTAATPLTLTTGPGDHLNPDINGDTVVWEETLTATGAAPLYATPSNIAGRHVRSGSTFTVTSGSDVNTNPKVSDGTVVYGGKLPYTGPPPVIKGANLSTGKIVTVSAPGAAAKNPVISHGKIAWSQKAAAGDSDIYANGCVRAYSDVGAPDYFYWPVQWLSCIGALSGYGDGSFRPYANTTRGQLAKIIVGGEGWSIDTTGGPHFNDVPASNPFYGFIETAYNHGIISGYADGTFRWGNNVTRGQLSKIIVGAQGWAIDTSGGPHFGDVPASNPFYGFIETAYNHGIISGYADGTFRVGANATRGQIAKITYFALTAP
ncbi:MAG TPA: S-layer homology domain-containing protein, partial [Chloroflexia bacterium]|nr:S-layer homology domain-containing protein [Chloroflexia bacterium]